MIIIDKNKDIEGLILEEFKMLDTIKVNNKTIPWLVVERGFKIPSFNFEIETEDVPGRKGSVFKKREVKGYEFDLPLIVSNEHLSHGGMKKHDDILNEIVRFFDYDYEVPLQFMTQDWYWNAFFEGPVEIDKTPRGVLSFVIKVVLVDPYKYAATGNYNTAISDQVSIVNSGTADTPVTIEARALKNANFFQIAKGDEDYFMIGDDDVDKPLNDYSPLILGDELRVFKGWNKQDTKDFTDNHTGGDVGGAFSQSSSKESFYLNTESVTGSGWQGAMYKRSFVNYASAQDFSTTVKFGLNQRRKGAVHFAQYLYDTDGRVIASIGYSNPNANSNTGRIIVTLFNQNGDQVKIYDYKNNPSLYNMDEFVVYIKLERRSNQFKIKTWKYREIPYPLRKIAFDQHEKIYMDSGKFYTRPIASLSLYSAKDGNNPVMPLYIFGTYTRELLPKPKGARDMIIKKGDEILIDMRNHNVLVNEEPFLSEKTFGSNYFKVEKGHTELIISPLNTFDTTVRWQDRYL